MSWRTNTLMLQARNVGRCLGLNKWIAVLLNGRGYEVRYDQSFQSTLRHGDCVWDVGANVGYYTRQFAERVGSDGRVFAFEPSPANFARLTSTAAVLGHVTLVNAGLGREVGRLSFQQGADDLGATSRIVEGGGTSVEIRTGAELLASKDATMPNAIKIDVEGFELEVLQGMGEALRTPALRAIGIEVHFTLLRERGMEHAPKQIERLLQNSGFRVIWPDASHILALRPA